MDGAKQNDWSNAFFTKHEAQRGAKKVGSHSVQERHCARRSLSLKSTMRMMGLGSNVVTGPGSEPS